MFIPWNPLFPSCLQKGSLKNDQPFALPSHLEIDLPKMRSQADWDQHRAPVRGPRRFLQHGPGLQEVLDSNAAMTSSLKKTVGNREIHGVFFWVHLKASLKIEVYYSISRHKRNIIQFGNSMKFDPHEKKHPAIDNTVVHCNCFQCVSSGFIREVLPGSNTYTFVH